MNLVMVWLFLHILTEFRISLFQEVRSDSGWQKDAWSADGMCEGFYEIAPGESVRLEIEFWDDAKAVRMLGKFSEKGTDRSGLVVLATSDKLDWEPGNNQKMHPSREVGRFQMDNLSSRPGDFGRSPN